MQMKLASPFFLILFLPILLLSDESIYTTIKDLKKTPWKYDYKTVKVQGQVLKEPYGHKFTLIDDEYEIDVVEFKYERLKFGEWVTITGEFWGTRFGRHYNIIDISEGSLEKIKPTPVGEILTNQDQFNQHIVMIKGKVINLKKITLEDNNSCGFFRVLDGNYWINVLLHTAEKFGMNDSVMVTGKFFSEKYFESDTLYNTIEVK